MSKNGQFRGVRAIMSGDDHTGIWGTHDAPSHDATLKYSTHQSPEQVLSDNYFMSLRQCFNRGFVRPGENPYRPGDEIKVMCYDDDGTWQKFWIEVSYVDEHRIVVEQISETRRGGMRGDEAPKELADYKHVGFGNYRLFYDNGKPYRGGQTFPKSEAETLLGRDIGKKAEEAA